MNVKELFEIRPTNEEQNNFIITVGQHLATEQHFATREEAEEYRNTPRWETIIAIVAEMIETYTKIEEQTKEDSKEHKQ